jgi:hypothetical protein
LNGTQCLGKNNVGFVIVVDISFSMFGTISTAFSELIKNIMTAINPNLEAWRLILFTLGSGSTEITAAISLDNAAQAQAASSVVSS